MGDSGGGLVQFPNRHQYRAIQYLLALFMNTIQVEEVADVPILVPNIIGFQSHNIFIGF